MAGYYTIAVFSVAIAFMFSNGIGFALSFLGAAWIPCCAIGAIKLGIIAGDKQQKVGVPLVGLIPLAFGYWLSGKVDLHVFGHHLSGFGLFIVSCVIGLTVPLAWGGGIPQKSN